MKKSRESLIGFSAFSDGLMIFFIEFSNGDIGAF